ncbi:hypothetical protein GGH93_000140 [Coemansia aciculifera]|nr:hypothetical protein GGH93_000140 [Coemansia aciculifera]
MSLFKYTFLVVSLAFVHNAVAEMAEVGYAPQTLVAAQQYMINRPNFAQGDGVHGHDHGHEHAGEEPESAEFRDFEISSSEISSSEIKDNSAASPCGGYSTLTALLAAGSVWATVF